MPSGAVKQTSGLVAVTPLIAAFISGSAELTTLRLRPRSLLLLGTIAASAALAILLLAGTIKALVVDYRWVMYSLFVGLTLGGLPLVWRMARPTNTAVLLGATAAFAAMLAMALSGTSTGSEDARNYRDVIRNGGKA